MEPEHHPFEKENTSEPNLHDFGFKMFNFGGVRGHDKPTGGQPAIDPFQVFFSPKKFLSVNLQGTPPKLNILNPKSWRFGSDVFPFQMGDFQVPC